MENPPPFVAFAYISASTNHVFRLEENFTLHNTDHIQCVSTNICNMTIAM